MVLRKGAESSTFGSADHGKSMSHWAWLGLLRSQSLFPPSHTSLNKAPPTPTVPHFLIVTVLMAKHSNT